MKRCEPIAVVGLGGVFPGVSSLDAFWDVIASGGDAAGEPPEGRWILPVDETYDERTAAKDKVNSRRGCYIRDFRFDPEGLRLPADFLGALDPMFHLALHAGREAMRSAKMSGVDRRRIGVIFGNIALPTESSSRLAEETLGRTFTEKVLGAGGTGPHLSTNIYGRCSPDPIRSMGTGTRTHPINRYVAGLPAGVLAKALGLGAGSYTLDAACASSLYAVKLAVDELAAGRADAMLAGGLSRPDSLYTQMGFSQLRAVSPTGVCSPFDRKGNGLVVGEGCGMFVLKRLGDALRDGDVVHGVLRGAGLSNDVEGNLLAPSSEGQLRAMRAAYAASGWAPTDVDLIECHATGTPVGDAVEVHSLRELWGKKSWQPGQCVIGSVKSNVGHLLTGAGAAGLMKVLLALKHKSLPPTAHFENPVQGLGLDKSPFRVLSKTEPWQSRPDRPRRAALSGFGFGGVNAHILVEEFLPRKARKKASPRTSLENSRKVRRSRPESIAIVGMGAHFGKWDDLRRFQERVLGGGEAHEPTAPKGWGVAASRWFREAGHEASRLRGYYVGEVRVPLGRFRIPPHELKEALPQQLLMLKTAAEAARSAGWDETAKLDAGVFIGVGLDLNTTNFSVRWSIRRQAAEWAKRLGLFLDAAGLRAWADRLCEACGPALSADRTMGALGGIVASRVAREFRIGGPSFTIQNEESSGLRALETAVRALQQGEISRALVGAVDLAGDIRALLGADAARPFSAGGVARPFSREADGAVPGEGAAAVVLKRLSDAVRDGDRIFALVRGVGAAGGGGCDRAIPTAEAYGEALVRAYADAGVDPGRVGYVEAHGSGLAEEDRIEAEALGCSGLSAVLGSAKADVGHAGAASGLASLVKAALALHQEILPPLRNQRGSREELRGCFRTPKDPSYWLRDRADGPRFAGVSSMSVDGSCLHVVLEGVEPTDRPVGRAQPLGARDEALFAIAGDSAERLIYGLTTLKRFAAARDGENIESVARQWFAEHAPQGKRAVALVARGSRELGELIEEAALALREAPERVFFDRRRRIFYHPKAIPGKTAFVYPGSGNQFHGMGRALGAQWPEVLRRQDTENEFLRSQYLPELFWDSDPGDDLHGDTQALIFGQVALGSLATDAVRGFGIEPDAVIGYSLGESAGLFSLRAWSDRDEMLRRMQASTLFTKELAGRCDAARRVWKLPESVSVDWTLGVIDVPAEKVRAALKGRRRVYLLIVNTPRECVIGGKRRAVESLVKKLGGRFLALKGVTTVHCEVAQTVRRAYRELHLFATRAPRGVRFYSGAWGVDYELDSQRAAESVVEQALYGVDFPKVIEAAYRDGVRVFLEMGPGASCTRMIGEILGDRPHVAVSACSLEEGGLSSVLRLLAQCVAARVPFDLRTLYGGESEAAGHRRPGRRNRRELVVSTGGEPFSVPELPRTVPLNPRTVRAPVLFAPPPENYMEAGQSRTYSKYRSRDEVKESVRPAPAPTLVSRKEPVRLPPLDLKEWRAPVPEKGGVGAGAALLDRLRSTETAKARAHETFLRLSRGISETYAAQLQLQMNSNAGKTAAVQAPVPEPAPQGVYLDREQCLEFARGSIAKVLGAAYAEIDSHPTRVRLPDEPLMLVDRMLEVEGEPLSLGPGRLVTEHDVRPGDWYLDAGCAPVFISVESGQADLFLAGYLGIDFKTRGRAVYRLLDAAITFHRGLPRAGETIRYDIRIREFFRQGDTTLFRFEFDGTINGEPALSMRDGCAGFFTQEELDAGKGIVHTALDKRPVSGKRPADWKELAPMSGGALSDERVSALRRGDLEAAFGPEFSGLGLKKPVGLPDERMRLVDRIVEFDPQGGRFGLGKIRAEADIHPGAWFLTCHFVDDKVMPGTLMYESCLHTLRIQLMRLGWVAEEGEMRYEPVPGIAGRLKCRGQVTPGTKKAAYEISIKELGYQEDGTPYAIADALMYADGRPVVEMIDMSLKLTGLTRERVESLWRDRSPAKSKYDNESILAFATGKPSEAFGEPYHVFDSERVIARLPGPPYKFLDRVTEVKGRPFVLKSGSEALAHYDVPVGEWYFDSNRQPEMPFAILLEVALQPCGWLAAYCGSALSSEKDLSFRNLGGSAVQKIPVTKYAGTLSTRVKMTSVSRSAGMIIQHYDFNVENQGRSVYEGKTYFGFFSKEALADQVGLREAKLYSPSESERVRSEAFELPREAPFPDDQFRMLDRVDLWVPDGGPQGLGVIEGGIAVDPSFWFFKAHFYQDPVWPGSLGVESFLQLMKVAAAKRWGAAPSARFENVELGRKHAWSYRGQVLPGDRRVRVQCVVTAVDDGRRSLTADGFLTVDGRIIYEMKDFSLRLA